VRGEEAADGDVTVAADRIEIRLSRAKVAAALQAGGLRQQPDLDPVILSIEAKLRRAGASSSRMASNLRSTKDSSH
jgi:hypothetical protein